MLNDSILTEAGALFFAAWSLVIAVITVKAFGPDLLPSRAASEEAASRPTPKQHRTRSESHGT